MRYVLSVALVGMFVLVACRRPIIQPVPHQPINPADPLIITAPPGLTTAPAFNPSKLTIEIIVPNDEKVRLRQLEAEAPGVPLYQLDLITDALIPWSVQARGIGSDGKSLPHRAIVMDSFPDYGEVSTADRSAGDFEDHLYQFAMEYKEGQVIPLKNLTIVARDTSYCKRVFHDYDEGKEVEAVNGIKPDEPESESDCSKVVATNLYNFDQKVRLRLQITNVKGEPTRLEKAREKLICNMVNKTKDVLVSKATHTFANGNDLTALLKEIGINFLAGLVIHKLSISGLDCDRYEYRSSVRTRSYENPNTAGGEKHGPP